MAAIPVADLEEFQPPYAELGMSARHLRDEIGYGERDCPPAVARDLEEVLAGIAERAAPRAGYLLLPADRVRLLPESVELDSSRLRTGPIIAGQLAGSQTLALFLASAGPEPERWANHWLRSGDGLKGYLADLCGSMLAEAAASWLMRRLEEMAGKRGWSAGNRLSPGYCGWPVEDQALLFSCLPDKFCGVALTPSSLMVPLKSVSGIVGLGSGIKRRPYPCATCTRSSCARRTRH